MIFKSFIIKSFGRDIYLDNIKLYDAREEQINIKYDIDNSNNLWDQKKKKKKETKKALTVKNAIRFPKSKTFPRKKRHKEKNIKVCYLVSDCSCPLDLVKQLKILTPKQMIQRLPIARVLVKAGNTSENLLNEIHQIIYSLYRAK